MGTLTAFLMTLAAAITGPFGIAAITVAIAGSFIAAALHFLPPRSGFYSLALGAIAFATASIVQMLPHG